MNGGVWCFISGEREHALPPRYQPHRASHMPCPMGSRGGEALARQLARREGWYVGPLHTTTHIHRHRHTHTRTHTHTHTRTHTHTPIHTHARTHTHTQGGQALAHRDAQRRRRPVCEWGGMVFHFRGERARLASHMSTAPCLTCPTGSDGFGELRGRGEGTGSRETPRASRRAGAAASSVGGLCVGPLHTTTHIHRHRHTHIHTHTCTHTHKHTHTRAHTHTCTHTHVRTHKHTQGGQALAHQDAQGRRRPLHSGKKVRG